MSPMQSPTAASLDDLVPDELDATSGLDEYELEDLLGCHVDFQYED